MAIQPIPPDLPSAPDVLEREFLQLRANLLQVAAQLDRIDRAAGQVADDSRMLGVRHALAALAGSGSHRAQQVQMIFSRPYDAQWKSKMELEKR
jgi:hypothetical protein